MGERLSLLDLPTPPGVGQILAGRYRVTAVEGGDGGIQTLDAVDVQRGTAVVMLVVPERLVPADARLSLAEAVSALGDVREPHLVAPVHVELRDGLVVVARPHIRGTLLSDRLREGPLAVREAVALGADLLRGLVALHGAALLHLDISPAAIKLVHGSGRAALTFLALPRSVRLLGASEPSAAVARYASPEEAGIIHRRVDERSDLYSVGCVIYAALAGHPPHQGESVSEVLRQQLHGEITPLSTLREDVPPALDQVLLTLLATDPRDRYTAARAALDHLQEILAALESGTDPRGVTLRSMDRRAALADPEFVGRQRELAVLSRSLEQARQGHGPLVLLEAPSGGGKTRLLDEFAREADETVWVLRGQGRDAAAETPYGAIEPVINAVAARARRDAGFAGRLRGALGERAAEVVAVMPQLGSVLGVPTRKSTPARPARKAHRSRDALRILLERLGTDHEPVAVLLDDCQWADESTLDLLRDWPASTDPSSERRHVLLVVAARLAQGPGGAPVAAIEQRLPVAAEKRLRLAQLDSPEIERLAESMAGTLPIGVSEVVSQMSAGSPLVAAEMMRGLVDSDVLRHDAEGWQVDGAKLDTLPGRSADAVIAQRIEQLSGPVLDVLESGAVLGKQFALDAAAELAGLRPTVAITALAEARRRAIVDFDAELGHWTFLHDRLRETILGGIAPERLRDRHRLVAERLEATAPSLVFEIAYHFDAAGEPRRALPHALEAARAAHRRHALDVAERYYRIAARAAEAEELDLRRHVAEGLGDIALLRGSYPEAELSFEQALAASRDPVDCADVEGRLGELAFKRGDVELARQRAEAALTRLGEPVPRRRLSLAVWLVREVVVQLLHTLMPGVFVGRRAADRAGHDLLVARLYSELAHAYWFGSGLVPCAFAHLRGLNRAERYPPSVELAQAYSEHAPAATMVPAFRRGMAYAQRSLEIRRALGDIWGEGQSLHFYGVVLYSSSRYEEALECCRAAVEILERTGDQWEISTASWHIAACLYRLGRLEEAVAMAREVHDRAVALGDTQAAGIALGFWAKASAGRLPAELVEEALVRTSADVHTSAEVRQAAALVQLAAGEHGRAAATLEEAVALVRDAGLRQEYVAPVWAWLATALRRELEAMGPLSTRRRRKLARRARRAARKACRVARHYTNNLPHAQCELGMLEAMRGRTGRARRLLERSRRTAEAQGAAYELAHAERALAQLDLALGRSEASTRLARVERRLFSLRPASPAESPDVPTLSLAERFSTVLEAGRAIASALSREAVYAAVYDAAVALLRTEACTVFALGAGDPETLTVVAGEDDPSGALAAVGRQVVRGDRIVLVVDDAAGVGSTLCAVIRARGTVVGCLCVRPPAVAEVLGEQEKALAQYIVTLAGAALENAQGFAASEAMARSLERRVQERTAELRASQGEMQATLSLLAATLESTADGILVVDADGRTRSCNRKFAEMWRVPAELLEFGDGQRLQHYLLEQLADPEAFLAAQREVAAAPESESQDVLELGDGRVYERISKPQLVDGRSTGRVWSFRDITLQKRSERELEHLANHDGLTGLANRRYFEHELERTLAHVERYGSRAALLLLDLDNFKYVNDTLGHGAGDEVIKSVASLLSRRLRGTDLIARFGGDEFAVLLRESDEAAAEAVAVELLTEIRHHTASAGGQRVTMTASIGVALLDGSETEVSQLLADADLAMYEAKRAGRDGVSVYGPERARAARAEARLTWTEQLRSALEEERFELFVQPIFSVARRGEVSGYEVLLRLPGSDGTMLRPGAFMPTAERLGRVLAIDRWVVSRAIRTLGRGPASGHLSINLSGTSIGDPELPGLIAAEIQAAGVDPHRLIFEVTETATIANMNQAKRFAEALTGLGCRFALDDFGTGFGSFYYLKHLPVDILKIDGDFIGDLPDSATDEHVVRAIVEIARGTGKETVAECVGDPASLRRVEALGIDYAQGDFLGRPRPFRELLEG